MDEIEQWLEWRKAERRKHRTMTMGEYAAWCQGGDSISHPSDANAFPGGITLVLNTPAIIGKTSP